MKKITYQVNEERHLHVFVGAQRGKVEKGIERRNNWKNILIYMKTHRYNSTIKHNAVRCLH